MKEWIEWVKSLVDAFAAVLILASATPLALTEILMEKQQLKHQRRQQYEI